MKRIIILSGFAIWLVGCANSGAGTEYTDTANETQIMEPTSDPRDTAEIGIGAGAPPGIPENVGAGGTAGAVDTNVQHDQRRINQ